MTGGLGISDGLALVLALMINACLLCEGTREHMGDTSTQTEDEKRWGERKKREEKQDGRERRTDGI